MKSRRPSHRATHFHVPTCGMSWSYTKSAPRGRTWIVDSGPAARSLENHALPIIRRRYVPMLIKQPTMDCDFSTANFGANLVCLFFAAAGRLRKQKVLVNKLQFALILPILVLCAQCPIGFCKAGIKCTHIQEELSLTVLLLAACIYKIYNDGSIIHLAEECAYYIVRVFCANPTLLWIEQRFDSIDYSIGLDWLITYLQTNFGRRFSHMKAVLTGSLFP